MKTRTWILILASIFIACAVLTLFLFRKPGGGYAQVYSDGVLYRIVDLSQDTEFTVEGAHGYNVIRVQDGTICVCDASCPDGTCMKYGAKNSGIPIICLPNRLEIRFTDTSGVDAVAG